MDNYPYDDPNIAKKGCATCGHRFRSGEERSVELATGRQICDKCKFSGLRAGEAPIEDRMQLSEIKKLYGIETQRRLMRDDGDEYIGEKVIERKPFLREMFMSEQNAPPEWLQDKRDRKREVEERSHDTLSERRRRARYSRTHGTMPRE